MSPSDVFRRIISALEHAQINYMLTGSFASAYYGAPRSTQDIDLVIEASAEQLKKFAHLLPAQEYYTTSMPHWRLASMSRCSTSLISRRVGKLI
jgi:hypothetical protein